MIKGGKQQFSKSNGGKWFAHPDVSESEMRSGETCTTSGIMLSQDKTPPLVLNFEHFPKWKTQQKPREFPLSCHDNKKALKDDITIFSNGAGRRKFPDHLRQNSPQFCLCDGRTDSNAEKTRRNLSTYKTDFTSVTIIDVPNRIRRFPQNHKLRSLEAAKAQAGEKFM